MKLYLRFIPMATIMVIIFFLSSQPGNFVHFPQVAGIDKLLHLVAYGVLAGTFLYGLHPVTHETHRGLTVVIVLLFCILYGISDEFHQSFVPGRMVSVWDVVADGCGALLAVTIWYRRTAAQAGKNHP